MPIGKLTLEIHIGDAQSLKDRRQVVRSLKAKLGNRFNASVAEINEGATLYNQATVACAVISGSAEAVAKTLEAIDSAANAILLSLGAELADSFAEILPDS